MRNNISYLWFYSRRIGRVKYASPTSLEVAKAAFACSGRPLCFRHYATKNLVLSRSYIYVSKGPVFLHFDFRNSLQCPIVLLSSLDGPGEVG